MNDFRFPKGERLKSRKQIQELFATGKVLHVSNLRFIYQLQPKNTSEPFLPRIGFGVPKRNFKKAVDRQLIKRRLREAYRLNRTEHFGSLSNVSLSLDGMILYQSQEVLTFDEIQNVIKQLLDRIVQLVQDEHP